MTEEKTSCYSCKYQRDVIEVDANPMHSHCTRHVTKPQERVNLVLKDGRSARCKYPDFDWPGDFWPDWIESCDGFERIPGK